MIVLICIHCNYTFLLEMCNCSFEKTLLTDRADYQFHNTKIKILIDLDCFRVTYQKQQNRFSVSVELHWPLVNHKWAQYRNSWLQFVDGCTNNTLLFAIKCVYICLEMRLQKNQCGMKDAHRHNTKLNLISNRWNKKRKKKTRGWMLLCSVTRER